MDVTRKNFFEDNLIDQEFASSLRTALFVSIDLEFTGIRRETEWFDTFEERYQLLKHTAQKFLPIQVGVSIFQKHPTHADRLTVKAFNFNTFPSRAIDICVCADAAKFLCIRNGFSYDKCIKEGIGYQRRTEEAEMNQKMAERRAVNQEIPAEQIAKNEKALALLTQICHEIDEWIELPHHTECVGDGEKVAFETGRLNGFERKLLHQEISKKYPFLHVETTRPSEKDSTISIYHLGETDLKQVATLKEKLAFQKNQRRVGFRRVWDLISQSKALLVGHNMLLDILFLFEHYVDPLPPTFSEFAALIHDYFPNILDTKYFAEYVSNHRFSNTALETVHQELLEMPNFHPVQVSPPKNAWFQYDLYQKNAQVHQAGYDSLITGKTFANLYKHTFGGPIQEVCATNQNIIGFINNLYMGSSHFSCYTGKGRFPLFVFRESHAFYISGKGTEDLQKIKNFARTQNLGHTAVTDKFGKKVVLWPKASIEAFRDPLAFAKQTKRLTGWDLIPFEGSQVVSHKALHNTQNDWGAWTKATLVIGSVVGVVLVGAMLRRSTSSSS